MKKETLNKYQHEKLQKIKEIQENMFDGRHGWFHDHETKNGNVYVMDFDNLRDHIWSIELQFNKFFETKKYKKVTDELWRLFKRAVDAKIYCDDISFEELLRELKPRNKKVYNFLIKNKIKSFEEFEKVFDEAKEKELKGEFSVGDIRMECLDDICHELACEIDYAIDDFLNLIDENFNKYVEPDEDDEE